jgi:aryl-alcohol dehydrogenase-like predicted oxidoreductase
MKLGLGTVQFGLDYGISNRNGQTEVREVTSILQLAGANGVNLLDTAPAYGYSEQALGTYQDLQTFSIVTKTPSFAGAKITSEDINKLYRVFQASLHQLRTSKIYGLLVHNANDITKPNGKLLLEAMADLKHKGLVKKIGVSIYNRQQIDSILSIYPIDLVQVPINVLDQRLLEKSYLASLKKAGIEIHARSIFLQGLLLMPPSSLPQHFQVIHPLMEKYHKLIAEEGITPLQAAINFVKRQKEIDYLITGVTSTAELADIIEAFETNTEVYIDFGEFACSSESIVNPSLWPKRLV